MLEDVSGLWLRSSLGSLGAAAQPIAGKPAPTPSASTSRSRLMWLGDPENKKGPPFGEPFLILRMVRHQESKNIITI